MVEQRDAEGRDKLDDYLDEMGHALDRPEDTRARRIEAMQRSGLVEVTLVPPPPGTSS